MKKHFLESKKNLDLTKLCDNLQIPLTKEQRGNKNKMIALLSEKSYKQLTTALE